MIKNQGRSSKKSGKLETDYQLINFFTQKISGKLETDYQLINFFTQKISGKLTLKRSEPLSVLNTK